MWVNPFNTILFIKTSLLTFCANLVAEGNADLTGCEDFFAIDRDGFQLACDLAERHRDDLAVDKTDHVAVVLLADEHCGCRAESTRS